MRKVICTFRDRDELLAHLRSSDHREPNELAFLARFDAEADETVVVELRVGTESCMLHTRIIDSQPVAAAKAHAPLHSYLARVAHHDIIWLKALLRRLETWRMVVGRPVMRVA